jgi:hypothetical protein
MHGRAEEDGAGASVREGQERRRDPSAQVSAAQGGAAAVAAVPPPRRSATVQAAAEAAPLQKEATTAARRDDRFRPVVHCCKPSRAAATLGASCPSAPAAGGWLTFTLAHTGTSTTKTVVAAALAARQRYF